MNELEKELAHRIANFNKRLGGTFKEVRRYTRNTQQARYSTVNTYTLRVLLRNEHYKEQWTEFDDYNWELSTGERKLPNPHTQVRSEGSEEMIDSKTAQQWVPGGPVEDDEEPLDNLKPEVLAQLRQQDNNKIAILPSFLGVIRHEAGKITSMAAQTNYNDSALKIRALTRQALLELADTFKPPAS